MPTMVQMQRQGAAFGATGLQSILNSSTKSAAVTARAGVVFHFTPSRSLKVYVLPSALMPFPLTGTAVAMSGTILIESRKLAAFGYETSWRVNARSSSDETV